MSKHHRANCTDRRTRAVNRANVVFELIETMLDCFACSDPPQNQRQRVARALLRASVDHALAGARLMAIEPYAGGSSAAALIRPQVETFLRGALFANPVTSELDLHHFLEDSSLPRRADDKGKMRPISLKQMALEAEAFLKYPVEPGRPGKLVQLLDNSLSAMHDVLHGGRMIVESYRGPSDTVEWSGSEETIASILQISGSWAGLAYTCATEHAGVAHAKGTVLHEAMGAFKNIVRIMELSESKS